MDNEEKIVNHIKMAMSLIYLSGGRIREGIRLDAVSFDGVMNGLKKRVADKADNTIGRNESDNVKEFSKGVDVDWYIDSEIGIETVHEKHRSWS